MIVLDTNVLSEAMKLSPDPVLARWMTREHGRGLFTTAVSEAEIIYGIAILPEGRRKRDLGAAAQGVLNAIRWAHPPVRQPCRSRVRDRKSTRLNSSHDQISYAFFCLKKKQKGAGSKDLQGNHKYDEKEEAGMH